MCVNKTETLCCDRQYNPTHQCFFITELVTVSTAKIRTHHVCQEKVKPFFFVNFFQTIPPRRRYKVELCRKFKLSNIRVPKPRTEVGSLLRFDRCRRRLRLRNLLYFFINEVPCFPSFFFFFFQDNRLDTPGNPATHHT